MKQRKRVNLRNVFVMVFTFAMVMVCAGGAGKLDAQAAADATCTVTVTVKDKETGEIIPDAKVIFTEYYRNSTTMTYPVVDVTQNEDGTYNVPYDSSYGTYYRYYAEAEGYKDSRTTDYYGILYGARLTINSSAQVISDISLEKYLPVERLQNAITSAQNEIEGYVNTGDYDAEQVSQINSIIRTYLAKIEEIEVDEENESEESANEKIEKLNAIVESAKADLDAVATSQDNINEAYADSVSFTTVHGDEISLARKDNEYGQYEITLGLFDQGGVFKVDNDEGTSVTWDATKELFYQSAGSNHAFEYIDNMYTKGMFLNSKSFADEVTIEPTDGNPIKASVIFTKDEKEVTVTFDLNVVRRESKVKVMAPEQVVLTRDEETLAYNVKVEKPVAVESNDNYYSPDIIIESLDEDIAVVKDNVIIPLKSGTGTFKALAAGCESVEFEIAFVMTEEEQKEIADADNVLNLINAVKDVTLDKEKDVSAAKEAYDALSENARKRIDASTVRELEKAEWNLRILKAEAAQKAAEEAKEKAEAARKAAEEKAAIAEQKANAAQKEAAEAKKAVTDLLPKLTLKAKAGKKKVTLTWSKTSKASGYIIYRSTKKNGTYKQVKVIKNAKTKTWTNKKLTSKKTYYYKIRVYKGTVKGKLSAPVKVKVK